MFPTRRQHDKWSLPSKWSFWAAVIGIPVGLLSLVFGLLPFLGQDQATIERNRLILQVAHELRYNDEWLSSLAIATQRGAPQLPIGTLKTEALANLLQREHDWVIRGSYGEEKHVYQNVLLLRDLRTALGFPKSSIDVVKFQARSGYTLHDVHFLNNFLFWYIRPVVVDTLSASQLYSLGWSGLPGERFNIAGISTLNMKRFVDEEKPINEYGHYLGLID